MRAAAVDAVLVPAPRVHQWLDEQAERILFLHLEAMQNFSQLGVLAAALDEIGEIVADLVTQESLHAGEVDELGIADRVGNSPAGRVCRVLRENGPPS